MTTRQAMVPPTSLCAPCILEETMHEWQESTTRLLPIPLHHEEFSQPVERNLLVVVGELP
jgi:hypothetical protein